MVSGGPLLAWPTCLVCRAAFITMAVLSSRLSLPEADCAHCLQASKTEKPLLEQSSCTWHSASCIHLLTVVLLGRVANQPVVGLLLPLLYLHTDKLTERCGVGQLLRFRCMLAARQQCAITLLSRLHYLQRPDQYITSVKAGTCCHPGAAVWGQLAYVQGTLVDGGCILTPPGEYSEMICAASAMWAVASINVATCCS